MKRIPLPPPDQNNPAIKAYREAVKRGKKIVRERKENGERKAQ